MQNIEKHNLQESLLSLNANKFYLEIIRKNLKKYIVSQNRYNRYIINHIIFIRKKTIVSRFKDHLMMNDIGEYLKRFYLLKESKLRLPKINKCYQKYTLFSPVYFGYDFSIIFILKKFCKRKKKYLNYIEELELNEVKKNKNNNNEKFELLIKPELVETNDSKEKTITSIELTEFNNENEKEKRLSEILNDLSSTIIETKKKKIEILKENIKGKIENLKQTKLLLDKKLNSDKKKNNNNNILNSKLALLKRQKSKLLLLKNESFKPSLLQNINSKISIEKEKTILNQKTSIIKNKEKNKRNNEQIFPLKMTKIMSGLKLKFNNLQKGTIPFSKISFSERFIPKKSDDLIKEKLGWLKKNKIKIKNNLFTDSLLKKNSSRNKNKIHLVLKHVSSYQHSSISNSNESKLFKTSEPIYKKKMRIKMNTNNVNINKIEESIKKSRNCNSLTKHNSRVKKFHLTENNSRYPSVIRNHNSSDKQCNVTDNLNSRKKKSFVGGKQIRLKIQNNLFQINKNQETKDKKK